jgi:bifunctional DNA-binding transcriptional regulator/antitoxin component of YhaV-PrlF toxin-antitoxin module
MTYTATISSKGQITIPIEARRKLKLGKTINLDIRGNELVIKAEPTIEEIRAILKQPDSGDVASDKELNSPWSIAAQEKDRRLRGY